MNWSWSGFIFSEFQKCQAPWNGWFLPSRYWLGLNSLWGHEDDEICPMLCLKCSIRGERKREIPLDSKRNRESLWIFGYRRDMKIIHTNNFHHKPTTFTLELFPLQPLHFSLFFLRDANKTPATWKFATGIVDSFFANIMSGSMLNFKGLSIFLLKSIISMWTTSKKLAKTFLSKKSWEWHDDCYRHLLWCQSSRLESFDTKTHWPSQQANKYTL